MRRPRKKLAGGKTPVFRPRQRGLPRAPDSEVSELCIAESLRSRRPL